MGMGYTTETDEMQRAVLRIRDVNGDIAGLLKKVRQEVQDSQEFWQGSAQSAFTGLMERWDVNAHKLNLALGNIANTIEEIVGGYREQERQHDESLSHIMQELNLDTNSGNKTHPNPNSGGKEL